VFKIQALISSSGGLEMLFENQKKIDIEIPTQTSSGSPVDIAFLVDYLANRVMKDSRKELFILHGSV
jgi:ubiquitin related modifier 1